MQRFWFWATTNEHRRDCVQVWDVRARILVSQTQAVYTPTPKLDMWVAQSANRDWYSVLRCLHDARATTDCTPRGHGLILTMSRQRKRPSRLRLEVHTRALARIYCLQNVL